ncbi:MAG: hypothetical protein KGM99_15390 [Burkholderiales bacterium]|nr:hypothetical protein [Burkholderiales bacterium]
MDSYGFLVGWHIFNIEAESEQAALIELATKHFDDLVVFGETIELLGKEKK